MINLSRKGGETGKDAEETKGTKIDNDGNVLVIEYPRPSTRFGGEPRRRKKNQNVVECS